MIHFVKSKCHFLSYFSGSILKLRVVDVDRGRKCTAGHKDKCF